MKANPQTAISVLGVDVGGTNIRMGLVDAQGRVAGMARVPSAEISHPDGPARLAALLAGYLAGQGGARPDAVSIGFPSTVNRERTRLLSTPNLEGFDGVEIADILTGALSLPVLIDRDVNLLFRHDCWALRLPAEGVVLGVYVGTGIGNAIAHDGRILRGCNGVAGELGHIPLPGVADVCGCGNIGCAETRAGGRRLAAIQAEAFPDTPIDRLFALHAGAPQLRDFIDCLSIVVATEVNLLDPEAIILGGGVLGMEGFPRGLLEERLRAHMRKPYPAENLRVCYAAGGAECGVIGAALAAFEA